ncbi:MAG: TraB/GumN family protein, partial [Saprospiraceae bacterium]
MSSSSLLWALTPPQGKTSWLFGTMHIRDDRVHQLSNALYPLILEADCFMGEMDLEMTDFGTEPVAYDIKKIWSKEVFKKVQTQLLKSFQFDIIPYSHLHPLMIMSAISTSVLQSEHHISLDEHLWNYAKKNGKKLLGLESYEEQFTLLHSIDPIPLYRQIIKISKSPAGLRKSTQ